jgi:organic radical activating enzyme
MRKTLSLDDRPYSAVFNNPSVDAGLLLPLMEQFYTLQGEGYHAGKAAFFIRLGGCPVGCAWCDVKESWDVHKHPLTTIGDMVKSALEYPGRMAVITGGEPAAFELGPLTGALKEAGFRTHIETSGAYALSGEWDWVCFSPKKFKKPHTDIYEQADELKVVVYNLSDFAWADQHAALVRPDCTLLLQPEWSKSAQMLPKIIDYVKDNPKWRITLQTHKFMDIP